MTNLRCTVTSCANNSQDCCCRPDIKVAGACACGCEQTCCSDFMGKSGSATNVSSCGCSNPNPSLHVRCEARNCIYNENNECIAENIHVADGSSGKADSKSQTECATFKMR